jgi:glycosyltransferase involved in cell wall biosynthesis
MTFKTPKVSIGLPVFNGEKYLAEAIDSILSQTYRDFELIISDNASTDDTELICQSYVAKDSRVRYYKNETNVGVSANFNRVFQLSSSEYFKWVACDDICTPDFLEKCVKVLDANPSVVVCHSKTGRINDRGEPAGNYDLNLKIGSPKPHERFGDLICMDNEAWVLVYGLMRSEALKKTQLMGSYIGADRNLLAEIGLIGRFFEIPEYLFFRREYLQSYTDRVDFKYCDKLKWWTGTNGNKKMAFPYWKICLEYLNSVGKSLLPWSERQRCYAQIAKWLFRQGWVLMGFDLGVNISGSLGFRKKLLPLAEWFLRQAGIKK